MNNEEIIEHIESMDRDSKALKKHIYKERIICEALTCELFLLILPFDFL